jgi:hypothetical protein
MSSKGTIREYRLNHSHSLITDVNKNLSIFPYFLIVLCEIQHNTFPRYAV